jgi:hypothetical protein
MPLHCPACEAVIEHDDESPVPQWGVVYRCHVCRLELVFDPETNRLVVVVSSENT